MKKKVMLLIIILPLIFMLTLFTIGVAVAVIIKVPVSGIVIATPTKDGVLTIDISDYDAADLTKLEVRVEPLNAANREWSYTLEGDSVQLIEGKGEFFINPLKVGMTKITVRSADGGYTDALNVDVVSSRLWDFEPVLSSEGNSFGLTEVDLNNYEINLSFAAGMLYQFTGKAIPSSFGTADVEWISDNPDVLKISKYTGFAKAMSEGTATVTATTEGGLSGKLVKKIKVTVDMGLYEDETTVNGVKLSSSGDTEVRFGALGGNARSFTLILPTVPRDVELKGFDVKGDDIITKTTSSLEGNQLTITIIGDDISDSYLKELEEAKIKLKIDGKDFTFTAVFSDNVDFDIYTSYHSPGDKPEGAEEEDGETVYQREGSTVTYTAYSDFDVVGVSYEWHVEGDAEIVGGEGAYRKIFIERGEATLTVVAKDASGKELSEETVAIRAVESVYSIAFSENNSDWGLEKLFTTGDGYIQGNSYSVTGYELKISYRESAQGAARPFDRDKILISLSDLGKAKNDYDNHISINGSGIIEAEAEWIYGDYFGADVSAVLRFRVVKGGVNVSTYEELKAASSSVIEGVEAVVLQGDIMLGKRGISEGEASEYYSEMYTTYDWKYYSNLGESAPKVKYLIKFTHDLYGNGYYLDGDYLTTASKGASSMGGQLIFNGPLDFVRVGQTEGAAMAAVKGQDNIVFLAKGNITINNAVLRGCSDSSLLDDETGEYDLSKLNTVGTTLEVMGNVQLLNSRVSNGRTVVRIFGGGGEPDGKDKLVTESNYDDTVNTFGERYTVRIDGCILSRAREFILKIGTNRAIRATTEGSVTKYPYLKDNGITFVPDNATGDDAETYGTLPEIDGVSVKAPDYSVDSDFYKNFVLTDVTLKNSVLQDSGLFTVGMEAHFSGSALAIGEQSQFGNWLHKWYDLAATSFGTVLRLEGDVRLLDWKNIDNVDSSTLIEISGSDSTLQRFKLDIKAMLLEVRGKEAYKNVVSDIDGNTYAHGGIALYGGGLNYAGIDVSKLNATTEGFQKYKINLGDFGNNTFDILKVAAGRNDFVFYMYDNTSRMNYAAEQALRQSGKAYELPVATE